MELMTFQDVSEKLQHGGTFLFTARSAEFGEEAGKKKAAAICKEMGIDTLVVIGGDGSFTGAKDLSKYGVNVIGLPGTIDLDIAYTEYTIGFDTAVNTAMEAIDRLRETSNSHERCSVVEVMGRSAGYIALWCGIANGAEEILLPERFDNDYDKLIEEIKKNREAGMTHQVVINAEGVGHSYELAQRIEEATGVGQEQRFSGIYSEAEVLQHVIVFMHLLWDPMQLTLSIRVRKIVWLDIKMVMYMILILKKHLS